jgi:DNA-binding NarL/FixJ family response regulator
MNSDLIRISIVDDAPEILHAVAAMIADAAGMTLTGLYQNAEDFIAEHPFTTPDVVFMDVGLPAMNGIECIRLLKRISPETHFVVFTVFEDSHTVFEAIKAGASGYLLKSSSPEKIVNAVYEVLKGESPLTGSVATLVMSTFRNNPVPDLQAKELEPAEKTLLSMLAEGYRYKDIAARLGLSEQKIRESIRHIYQKLQINDSIFNGDVRDPADPHFGRYLNTNVKPETEEDCYHRLLKVLTTEKPFLAERYTIGQLSASVGYPVYVVSQTINRKFNRNFFDLINHFRVLEAAELLRSRRTDYTIDGIALICGFNSKTTFYKSFRKEFGVTPGEFAEKTGSSL